MFSALKNRRPWAVALINLVFGSFVGMLYLNRAMLALIYLGVEYLGVAALLLFVKPSAFFAHGLTIVAIIELVLRIVGTIQGISIARERPQDEPLHWYSRWYAVVAICVFLPAISLSVRAFLYRSFDLPASSMSPTLNKGDYFLVWESAYRNTSPQRGDVVVFKWKNIFYVKRIVGVPGDRVRIVEGKLYINKIAPSLRRIENFNGLCEQDACPVRQFVETLPGGRPHRILDLIDHGPVDNTPAYFVPANSYFVMGDNRDNSADSRTILDFVPMGAILGRAQYKFVDAQTQRFTWIKIE